jgi:hypothetical protein
MHPITVAGRRAGVERQQARHPDAAVLDLTSRGPEPWVRFSPFWPHGGIPVPLSPGRTAASVEGIWQALKVFEHADVDETRLDVTTMRGLKRTTRRFGAVRGHRAGLDGDRLLPYLEARREIYLPAYRWVLEHRLTEHVAELRRLADEGPVVLLDYETNVDVDDPARPLSHAGLVAAFVTSSRPDEHAIGSGPSMPSTN